MRYKVTAQVGKGALPEPGLSSRSAESMRRLQGKVSQLSMQRDYWKQRCTELNDSRHAVATELARLRDAPGESKARVLITARNTIHEFAVDLTDEQADGRTCARCGRGGRMVQIGVVDRPAEMLERLGASLNARFSPIVAHAECLHLA
jgi:hypothetical protein